MRLDKFTQKAQEAILEAQEQASQYNHSQIEPEHLLLALLTQADGVVPQVVQKLGGDARRLAEQVVEVLGRKPRAYGATVQVGLSAAIQEVLRKAQAEAEAMRDEFVSTEHLLMALTDRAGGEATKLLAAAGISRDRIRRS